MKVLGKTQTGFIVEMEDKELCNLLGYRGVGDTCLIPQPGDVVPVSQMYSQLYWLADHEEKVRSVQAELQRIIERLEPVKAVLAELNEGNQTIK